ncbi:MAG: T9SS type A sorting domain-containing protein [Salibacteraceae bacterium]|nr:T9SS type A sorting domain-containing protein [Salibacteraceae bacterium]
MKYLSIVLFTLLAISAQSQEIPNGDFENWVQNPPFGEEPVDWSEAYTRAYNSLAPGIVDSAIIKTGDAYLGNFAMEIRSKTIEIFRQKDTIVPLVLMNVKNGDFDLIDIPKIAIDNNLESLSGFIKQDIVNADSNHTSISIYVYSGDSIIGAGVKVFNKDIINYTKFNVPILYYDTPPADSVNILIQGGNLDYKVPGNVMLIDGLKFNYESTTPGDSTTTGLKEVLSSEIRVYPNPFKNQLNIKIEFTEPKEFKIYSLAGETVRKGKLVAPMNKIDLTDLPPNIYFLTIENQSIRLIKTE